jgi:hypothetical protein
MVGALFDEAFEDFVTQRMDDLGSNAPDAVSEVIGQLKSCLELLVPTLTEEQKPLWMDMDNALSAQIGEETLVLLPCRFCGRPSVHFQGHEHRSSGNILERVCKAARRRGGGRVCRMIYRTPPFS